jgi:type II secretion system protein C
MKKRILLLCLVLVVIVSLETIAVLSQPKVNSIGDSFLSAANVSSPGRKLSPSNSLSPLVSAQLEAAPVLEEKIVSEEPLKMELIGTAMGNIKDPSAFIKDLDSGKQGIYKLGSTIKQAKIVKIAMGKVVLDVGGKEKILTMSERGKAWARLDENQPSMITLLGDHMLVDKSRLASESGKIIKDLKQVKVSPYYDSKKIAGMKVEGVTEDNILAIAGIHNQDVVTMVNSQKIDSYQKALQVMVKAKGMAELKVSVLRDGQPQLLCYKLQ